MAMGAQYLPPGPCFGIDQEPVYEPFSMMNAYDKFIISV